MRNKIRILAVLFLLSFSIYLEVYSQNNPIIFIHGNKSEATDTAGYKTFYPTDSQGDLVYSTAMTRILAGGYKGYKIGLKSNGTPAVKCNENTILKQMYDSKYIYNFSYYHPDGSPGAIGSNGNLTPNSSWEQSIYQNVVSQGSWAENLSDFIDKVLTATGASKVNIVAHSEGGLVAKSAIKYYGMASKVEKLLMIATPNYGVDCDFVAYAVTDLGNKWPLWMHRGGGLEIGVEKQLEEIYFNISPPLYRNQLWGRI